MSQAKLIQFLLVGVPLGMMLIGAASLVYTTYSPKAESREGGREAEMLRVSVNEVDLRGWVETLATKIGVRPSHDPEQLRRAAKWIQSELSVENMGYRKVEVQPFKVGEDEYRNVLVEIPGQGSPDEIIVVGAHYDSVPECPAANDNGTGVAALLALAKHFIGTENERTLRFVAFANEEPPHFQTANMGSYVYAKACQDRGESIVGMICLETIGYFPAEPGSQSLPQGLRRFYPDVGNFIAIIGNEDSEALVDEFHGSFARNSGFPAEKAALPESLPGVGWSDHWSFWQFGYPALMVTDTAAFRYPHYHLPTDTPDKIDFPRYTQVVQGVAAALYDLANPK